MKTVGNVKIALPENIALLLHPHVDIPWSFVLRNLPLDGKLCIRDDKNAAFVELHYPLKWQASLKNVTVCARNNRKLIG